MSASTPTTAATTMTSASSPSNPASSIISSPPPRFPYLFRNILDFPRRVVHPPSASVPRVGNVRSFKLTPCYRVSLQDVLHGRHLPPLGRKEFEDFLYFKEYSVENLYFYFWLEQYQAQWAIWAATQEQQSQSRTSNATTAVNVTVTPAMANTAARPVNVPKTNPSPQLAMSYARAKETFFTHGSPWELNLPQKTLQELLHPKHPHPGPKTHPHPSALAGVRFEIESYLTDSLTRFIAQNGGNAGRHRGFFAVVIGLVTIAIGLLPIILFSLPPHNHDWSTRLRRLGAIPVLWFGLATLIAGLHGVCVVIFLFGDARQLYPYELRRPVISSPISCAPGLTLNPNLAANAHERKRHSNARPTLPRVATNSLSIEDNHGGRQRSSMVINVSPVREKDATTEYVHLPNRKRTGTVTSSTSATADMMDGKYVTNVPDLDDSTLNRAVQNQLNFGLYDDEEDLKRNADSNSDQYGNAGVQVHTPTVYSTSLYPDTPIIFDFDALPLPPGMRAPEWKLTRTGSDATTLETFQSVPAVPDTWHNMEALSSTAHATAGSSSSSSKTGGVRNKLKQIKDWEWNRERTVFSPLTKVLDPVITRTQWEIVMRSAIVALVISIVISCGCLALP